MDQNDTPYVEPPYMKPPPMPILQTLPPELLHKIFSNLETRAQLVAMRQTCSLLASIGLDHFNDEVSLVLHRERFRAITEIAAHPKLSKYMRSLFYVAGRHKLMTFEEWSYSRPLYVADSHKWMDFDEICYTCLSPGPSKEDMHDFESLAAWGARGPRADVEDEQALRWQEARPSESEYRAGYEAYKALCYDQFRIERQGYDQDCIRALFEGCPKLREVTIASQGSSTRRLYANRVFANAMTKPKGDRHWWTENVHQAYSVAMAAARSEVNAPLNHLEEPDEPDEHEPDLEQMQSQFIGCLENGQAHEILSAATNLRALKLQLPRWYYDDNIEGTYSQLEPALRDVTYPHLYELSLSQCEVHADYLIDLCMRHKLTLRRLSLSYMLLLDDNSSFREVFTRLGGQLPKLRKVVLHGPFHSNLTLRSELKFDMRIDPFRDALENFIVTGGEYPNIDRARPPQSVFPDKSYMLPGLPDDDKEPDDPALDYDQDKFDHYR